MSVLEAVPRYTVDHVDDGRRETVQLQVWLPGERGAPGCRRCRRQGSRTAAGWVVLPLLIFPGPIR